MSKLLKCFLCTLVIYCVACRTCAENVWAVENSDGTYEIEVLLEGGTGRATIKTPTQIRVVDGKKFAVIEWSSPNYDYMLVNQEKYYTINESGNSVFEIPVETLDVPITVMADTVAMSVPHEIEYQITFVSNTMKSLNQKQKSMWHYMAGSALIGGIAICGIAGIIVYEKKKKVVQ